jgi:hypothetical protein
MPRTYTKSRGERIYRGSLFVQRAFGNQAHRSIGGRP